MTKNIVTMVSNKNYKEGWDRIFGGKKIEEKKESIWKCPACKEEFDYGEGRPIGKSYCSDTGKRVQMVRVKK